MRSPSQLAMHPTRRIVSASIALLAVSVPSSSAGQGRSAGSVVESFILADELEDLVIRVDTSVVWTNLDDEPHRVVSGSTENEVGHIEEGSLVDTGLLRPGESSSPVLFRTPGAVDIHVPVNGTSVDAVVTVLPAAVHPGPGPARGLAANRRFRVDGERVTGRVSTSDSVIVERQQLGDSLVLTRESTLHFTGDLEGSASFRSTEVHQRNGRINFQGAADFEGLVWMSRSSLQLGIVGSGSARGLSGTFTVMPGSAGGAGVSGSGTIGIPIDGDPPEPWQGDFAVPQVVVDVVVQPEHAGKLLYLPLAPQSSDLTARSLLILRPVVTNHSGFGVHLNEIRVSFLGPPFAIPVILERDIDIANGASKVVVTSRADNIVLLSPPPAAIVIDLYFDGETLPVSVFRSLQAHVSPVAGGSYRFPGRAVDLAPGTVWSGATGHKGDGQRYGYDMGVVRWDADAEEWTGKHPDAESPFANEDHLVWGTPIQAMADGIVNTCTFGVPDNPNPPEKITGGGGNNFTILHGDERVLYAHLQNGTVSMDICFPGALVEEGQILGLAGNSGSSTAPHLHIHSVVDATEEFRPLPFRNALVVEREFIESGNLAGAPWSSMEGQGPPHRLKNAIAPQGDVFP